VSTDCKSGPSEILSNGKFGFLCDVGNSEALAKEIKIALMNPKEPMDLVKRAEDFSENKIGKLYEDIIT
ncbi:glycosyltransferase, partial [Pseudomonas syringae]|uniref:glycosyltransferase n=1 Tax=Pseudomonas syringae TaxID=317 RepID=UPI001CA7DFA2